MRVNTKFLMQNIYDLSDDKMKYISAYLITLFEIFIFCPKIQLWFPKKIVDFLGGEKLVEMLWFWTF